MNYESTFILVAPDSPVVTAQVPPPRYRGATSVAAVQFAMIHEHPYRFTQEDVLYASGDGDALSTGLNPWPRTPCSAASRRSSDGSRTAQVCRAPHLRRYGAAGCDARLR
jgi:hypothetical protein